MTGGADGRSLGLPTGRWAMVTTTRDRILEEAAKLFTEKGYEATSLLALKGLVAAGEKALEVADPKAALLRFMEAHARYFEENRPFFVAMLQGLQSLSPEHREATVRLRDRHEENLRAILRRGVEQGVFREVDVALAGRAVLSMLNWMIRWFRPDGPMRAEEVARAYHDLILRGLERGGA